MRHRLAMHYIMPDLKTKPPLALCLELAGKSAPVPMQMQVPICFPRACFSIFLPFKLYVIVLRFIPEASAISAQLPPSCLPSPFEPVHLASSFVCDLPSSPSLIQHQPESLAGREHVCLCVCVRCETQLPLFDSCAHFPLGLAKHALALDLAQTQRTSAGEKPDSCTQLF